MGQPATPVAGTAAHLGEFKVAKCEVAILAVLLSRDHPVTRRLVGLQAGYSPRSGSFSNSISALRTKGWLEGTKEALSITLLGRAVCAKHGITYRPLNQDYWLNRGSKCERAILTVLLTTNSPIEKGELARQAGYTLSGSFSNSLSKLRGMELINGLKEISLAEELFE